MVGSAILRSLEKTGHTNIITVSRNELDLTEQKAVKQFFEETSPDQVYLAAAKVGGIIANNSLPADFIYENTMIQMNVIKAAFDSGVTKLLLLGSSCIYPKYAKQPIRESSLFSGHLEPTNEPYAISKILGIKLCESFNRQFASDYDLDYRSIMPTNLYGPGDNYHPEYAHVIPALINRFHQAKISHAPLVKVWGKPSTRREFLFVEDLADAAIYLMNIPKNRFKPYVSEMQSHINIGYGRDYSIAELAKLVKDCVGYNGAVEFDEKYPSGPPQKLLDSSLIQKIGWKPEIDLPTGLDFAYRDFLNNQQPTKFNN